MEAALKYIIKLWDDTLFDEIHTIDFKECVEELDKTGRHLIEWEDGINTWTKISKDRKMVKINVTRAKN